MSFSELEKVGAKKDKTLKTRLELENPIDNGSRKRRKIVGHISQGKSGRFTKNHGNACQVEV